MEQQDIFKEAIQQVAKLCAVAAMMEAGRRQGLANVQTLLPRYVDQLRRMS